MSNLNVMTGSNIILTGLPRSGTTLTCKLLNQIPNVVALHEPMNVWEFCAMNDRSEIVESIRDFFSKTRESISASGTALSMQSDGLIPDNPFSGELDPETGRRMMVQERQPKKVKFTNINNSGFSLILKHPAAFTALIENLVEVFPVYAVIRNPVSVLMSWNTLDVPISRGHAPMAECLDSNLKLMLNNIEDNLDRQISLLSWFFDKYYKYLPSGNIVRYEDIISSSGENLSRIISFDGVIDSSLKSKNNNPLYDQSLRSEIIDRLRMTADDWSGWKYYSRSDVLGESL